MAAKAAGPAPAKAAGPAPAKAAAGSVMTSSGRWTLTPGTVISQDMLEYASAEEVQEAYDWGMYESEAEQAFFAALGKPKLISPRL